MREMLVATKYTHLAATGRYTAIAMLYKMPVMIQRMYVSTSSMLVLCDRPQLAMADFGHTA
jgi:alpha-D-ribose 1-methylphosphonate 5-phosphate C-P lyase